jgi:hypothetical protein
LFLLATLHSEAIGCGPLKFHGTGPAEISACGWPTARVASGSAGACSRSWSGRRRPGRSGWKPTGPSTLLSLYRSAGDREVPAFNDEPYADLWFEKAL